MMPTIRCRQANACIRREGAFAFFGGVPRKVIYDSEAWPPSVRGQAERRQLLMRCLRAKSASSTGDFRHWPAIICLNRLSDLPGRIALPAAALHSRLRLGSGHWVPLVQAHWRGARSGTRLAPILDNAPRDPLPGTGRASPPHSRCHDRRDIRVGTADAAAGQHAV